MAEEKELDLDLEGGGKGGNKKMIIMIVVGALLLIGLTIGLMLVLLGGGGKDATDSVDAAAGAEMQKMQYIELKPAFTVTTSVDGRSRLLQVQMTVATRSDDIFDAVRIHMPLIRHSITALLGRQDFEALRTSEGKEQLRRDAIAEIQRIVNEEEGLTEGVESVLFTNLVMQ